VADPVPSLTIAVLTFQRPSDIEDILPSLVAQAVTAQAEGLHVSITVVDNDPLGSARETVVGFSRASAVDVEYRHEPVPGISAARNCALDSASDSDLLVFIDDDERPTDAWLSLLLSTWRLTGATAVVGPVVSTFEVEPDPWISAGQFFQRKRVQSGTVVGVAATNNLLLDLRFVRAHDIRFDLAFGITGGDDTMFTRELTRAGGIIVWCDEAIVMDIVPRHRITRRWVTLRAMSSGNSWAITSVKLERSAFRRLVTRTRLTGKGGVRLLGGGIRFAGGIVTGRVDLRARGVRTLARGVGMVGGAWGYKYLEYRRPVD